MESQSSGPSLLAFHVVTENQNSKASQVQLAPSGWLCLFLHEARERFLYPPCCSNPPFFFFNAASLVFSSPAWPLTVWSRICSVILALFSGLPPREQNSHLCQVPPNPLPGMRCASEGLGSQPTGNRHQSSCLISHSGNNTVTVLMVRLGSGQLTG